MILFIYGRVIFSHFHERYIYLQEVKSKSTLFYHVERLRLVTLFTVISLIKVLNQTQDHRQRVLHNVAKELPNWSIMVRKMKAIYHTMNLFNMDVSKKCLIGECWVPVSDLTTVQNCLTEGSVGRYLSRLICSSLYKKAFRGSLIRHLKLFVTFHFHRENCSSASEWRTMKREMCFSATLRQLHTVFPQRDSHG